MTQLTVCQPPSGAVHLDCCVCGGGAGRWAQHWNRDEGYGICAACVAEETVNETPERLKSLYGTAGVNYDRPTVRHYDRRFFVLGATRSQDKANAFMERTPGAAVLKVFDDDGLIVMAHVDDEGEPLPAPAKAAVTKVVAEASAA